MFRYLVDKTVQRLEGIPSKWDYIRILRPEAYFVKGIEFFIDSEVFRAYVIGTFTCVPIRYEDQPLLVVDIYSIRLVHFTRKFTNTVFFSNNVNVKSETIGLITQLMTILSVK